MGGRVGRNDPCICGSGKKFKRCCQGKAPASRSSGRARPGSAQWTPDLTLLVETARGPMLRLVPGASPLGDGESEGRAAETATHEAAALWGLPHFVYLPDVVQVGSGVRELADGVVSVGTTAMLLQVKRPQKIYPLPEPQRPSL